MLKEYNELTRKFLGEMQEEHRRENIVFSLYSIINLLAIAAQASNGVTRDEIVKSILPKGTYGELMNVVSDMIKKISDEGGVNSSSAAIIRKTIEDRIAENYEKQLNDELNGELLIANDIVECANNWVKEKTDGMIPKILNEDAENELLACLINVVLFDAEWKNKYREENCSENEIFKNMDGSLSYVTMLHSIEDFCVGNRKFVGFCRPYDNGYTYMALLPRKEGEKFMRGAIKTIDFCELFHNRKNRRAYVDMPEFSYDFSDEKLSEMCQTMGIKTLFTDVADLSNMSSEKIKIGSIIQKTRIEVDRKGTRAAATSAEVMLGGLPAFYSMILDRPFVYAIMNDETELPVFVGTVNNLPNEKST